MLTADATEVHYRVVSDHELELLRPMFTKLGWAMPNPDMAKVIVAETGEGADGIICGFAVVQFVTHAEPIWIHPELRGTGIAEQLVEKVVSYIERDCKIDRWVAVAKPGSMAARLCEGQGMVAYPGQLYVKQVHREE
jgi:ribosomal protein S18 acetylase RimI-like enzyme